MKKNQFALIFLTLLVMLAVWYIKTPINANAGVDGDGDAATVTEGRLEALVALRNAVRDERSIQAASLDEVIASSTATIAEKNVAIANKNTISDLTEKEVLLEVKVINMGYRDAFVHYTASGVEIIVVADENSGSAAVDIINMVLVSFSDTENVVVTFKTLQELTTK